MLFSIRLFIFLVIMNGLMKEQLDYPSIKQQQLIRPVLESFGKVLVLYDQPLQWLLKVLKG